MHRTQTLKEKLVLFLTILWPILVTQVGLYAMKLFDTMMSGQAGTNDLAGVAIGSSLQNYPEASSSQDDHGVPRLTHVPSSRSYYDPHALLSTRQ